MRLIDADLLRGQITWFEVSYISKREMVKIIDEVPTAEERPHGIWKYKDHVYVCSNCNSDALELEEYPYTSAYCPFCGAEMEIEDDGSNQE